MSLSEKVLETKAVAAEVWRAERGSLDGFANAWEDGLELQALVDAREELAAEQEAVAAKEAFAALPKSIGDMTPEEWQAFKTANSVY